MLKELGAAAAEGFMDSIRLFSTLLFAVVAVLSLFVNHKSRIKIS